MNIKKKIVLFTVCATACLCLLCGCTVQDGEDETSAAVEETTEPIAATHTETETA